MSLLAYHLFLALYQLAARIAAMFNVKAAKWVQGRQGLLKTIEGSGLRAARPIWIHCASVGEFEQARPLIEAIKSSRPEQKLVVTFFSPSGYELHKNYRLADHVWYLPFDGSRRSAAFVKYVNPGLAIFIKYEFWHYYFKSLWKRGIPTVIASASFRKEQPFFQWYGGFFRRMLRQVSLFFVQDKDSAGLLTSIGIGSGKVLVTGDTRYDRVAQIAGSAQSFPLLESWKGAAPLLIAGSTWQDDERIIHNCLDVLPQDWKLVVAPHELHQSRLKEVVMLFGADTILYSELEAGGGAPGKRVLIIDNMGMLSSLYRYGQIAFVGGGFQKGGIHNTLEPAVFGLPVLFGPVYTKFVDAVRLKHQGFGFPVKDEAEYRRVFQGLIADPGALADLQKSLRAYMQQNLGATRQILESLESLMPSGREY